VLDRGNEVLTYKRYSVYSIVHAFSFSHTVSLSAALQYLRLPDRTDTVAKLQTSFKTVYPIHDLHDMRLFTCIQAAPENTSLINPLAAKCWTEGDSRLVMIPRSHRLRS
jgi:hypothetical protein